MAEKEAEMRRPNLIIIIIIIHKVTLRHFPVDSKVETLACRHNSRP
jgi:hypothetical protein